MFRLGQTCVEHGASGSGSQNCCSGLTAWTFDSKTGVANAPGVYTCWNAYCIPEGQYAGPGGIDIGRCCSGLIATGGKCQVPGTGGGGQITCPTGTVLQTDGTCRGTTVCPTGQMLVGTSCVPQTGGAPVCAGSIVCSIPDMYLYLGIGAVALMIMMSMKKKKGGAV